MAMKLHDTLSTYDTVECVFRQKFGKLVIISYLIELTVKIRDARGLKNLQKFIRKVMRHINPSKVVPTRVRDALNSLAEGLLVLDKKKSIVLANDSFAAAAGESAEALIGTRPDRFEFQVGSGNFPGLGISRLEPVGEDKWRLVQPSLHEKGDGEPGELMGMIHVVAEGR